jgi:hypothetical protein
MDNKIRHLEFIQSVIDRMASNSFLIKGWCITLVSGLLGLAAKDKDQRFIIVVFFPALMFWMLDAYYLRQERLFRKKYDEVGQSPEESTDFSMNISTVEKKVDSWLRVAFSKTLFLFYGTMVGAILAIAFMLWNG